MKRKILLVTLMLPLLLTGCGYKADEDKPSNELTHLNVSKYKDSETGKEYIIFETHRGMDVKEIK